MRGSAVLKPSVTEDGEEADDRSDSEDAFDAALGIVDESRGKTVFLVLSRC